MQGTPVNIIVGSHVWVEDPEHAWIDGQVLKITDKNVEIQANNGKKVGGLPKIQVSILFILTFDPCGGINNNRSFVLVKVVATLSKLYPKDMEEPAGGVDDMTKLSYLHEPGVLQNLKTRYELNEIYVSFQTQKVLGFSCITFLLLCILT